RGRCVVQVDAGDLAGELAGAVELPGPRVDEVDGQRVPGEDACELQAHVPGPEDRDGRAGGQRLEQHGDLPAAALAPVAGGDAVVEREHEGLRGAGPGGEQLAGAVDDRRLEVSAPDGVVGARGGDDHLRPGLPGGVPAHRGDGGEHGGGALGSRAGECVEPVHQPSVLRATVAPLPADPAPTVRCPVSRAPSPSPARPLPPWAVRPGRPAATASPAATRPTLSVCGSCSSSEAGAPFCGAVRAAAAARASSTAQKTASGVAGLASSRTWSGGPNAWAARRSASRTEKASMSGGSPTALEP